MAKFKKGDRVRAIDTRGCVNKWATGTVYEDNCTTPDVKWDSNDMLNNVSDDIIIYPIHQDFLELIDEPTTDDIGTLFEQYKSKKAELQALKNKIIELL